MGSENSLLRSGRSLERPVRDFQSPGGEGLGGLAVSCCVLSCRATWDCSLISLVYLWEYACTRDQTDSAQVERSKCAKHSVRRVRST